MEDEKMAVFKSYLRKLKRDLEDLRKAIKKQRFRKSGKAH